MKSARKAKIRMLAGYSSEEVARRLIRARSLSYRVKSPRRAALLRRIGL